MTIAKGTFPWDSMGMLTWRQEFIFVCSLNSMEICV